MNRIINGWMNCSHLFYEQNVSVFSVNLSVDPSNEILNVRYWLFVCETIIWLDLSYLCWNVEWWEKCVHVYSDEANETESNIWGNQTQISIQLGHLIEKHLARSRQITVSSRVLFDDGSSTPTISYCIGE